MIPNGVNPSMSISRHLLNNFRFHFNHPIFLHECRAVELLFETGYQEYSELLTRIIFLVISDLHVVFLGKFFFSSYARVI